MLYLITGLALRFPGLLDYQARQFAKIVPAGSEVEAQAVALDAVTALAPLVEGWEGHTVRVEPLAAMIPPLAAPEMRLLEGVAQ